MQQRRAPRRHGQERRHEQQAQRQPHVQRVDPAAERARVAAGHRPRDLEAGPRLGDLAGRVVDVDLGQLLAVRPGREPAHLPAARRPSCTRTGSGRGWRRSSATIVGRAGGDPLDLRRGQPVARPAACVSVGDEDRRVRVGAVVAVVVAARAARRRQRDGRARARAQRRASSAGGRRALRPGSSKASARGTTAACRRRSRSPARRPSPSRRRRRARSAPRR